MNVVPSTSGVVDVPGSLYRNCIESRISKLTSLSADELKNYEARKAEMKRKEDADNAAYANAMDKYACKLEELIDWNVLPLLAKRRTPKPSAPAKPFRPGDPSFWFSVCGCGVPPTPITDELRSLEKTLNGVNVECMYHISIEEAVRLGIGK